MENEKYKMKSAKERKVWNLIVDENPLRGSVNMAIDDYLFQAAEKGIQTFLRFYTWEKPTVSLGYSQRIFKVADVEYCKKNGIDIVRRMTGGKLVLHHNEVTYSLCSSDKEIFSASVAESYKLISRALIRGLEKMGLKPYLADSPPDNYAKRNLPCFSYPARDEIEVLGKKIVGSAQKRVGPRFIQHGSIPLEKDEDMLKSISFLDGKESEIRLIPLSQALGEKVSFDWAVDHLKKGFAEFFGVILKPKIFIEGEMEAILKIQKERYASKTWTFLRR